MSDPKTYRRIKVEESVYKELWKLKRIAELKQGKEITFSDLIKALLLSNPLYNEGVPFEIIGEAEKQ